MITKKCPKCKQTKPLTEFRKTNKNPEKVHSRCVSCLEISNQILMEKEEIFNHKKACNLLKRHHEDLKYDPERLTTSFLQKIIGIDCIAACDKR